jgi:hypothetical protein
MSGAMKGKGSRRSRHEWRSLLAKFDASGLGVEAFCQREAISAGGGGVASVASATAPAFVDLGPLGAASASAPRCCMWCAADVLSGRPGARPCLRPTGRHAQIVRRTLRPDASAARRRSALGRPLRLHQPAGHADEGALLGSHRFLPLGQAPRTGAIPLRLDAGRHPPDGLDRPQTPARRHRSEALSESATGPQAATMPPV